LALLLLLLGQGQLLLARRAALQLLPLPAAEVYGAYCTASVCVPCMKGIR
jgi:hypothetical protein